MGVGQKQDGFTQRPSRIEFVYSSTSGALFPYSPHEFGAVCVMRPRSEQMLTRGF